MRKFSFLLLFTSIIAFAQSDVALQKIVSAPKITWLGLDFSDVSFIESTENPGFNDPDRIRDYYFKVWNEMVFSEPEKFNFREFFEKNSVDYRLSELNDSNLNVPIHDVIFRDKTKAPTAFRSPQVLQSIVDKYSYKDLEGIGATYIITEMSKEEAKATGYLAFIDFTTKEIIYSRLMTGDAGGFGFRNYWLGAFFRVYREIDLRDWLKKESRGKKRSKTSGSKRR